MIKDLGPNSLPMKGKIRGPGDLGRAATEAGGDGERETAADGEATGLAYRVAGVPAAKKW